MGYRATCPVCNSYSSDILADIENGRDCRVCGCPNDLLGEYQEILERKDTYKNIAISKEILEENDRLTQENFWLKTKLKKLIEILGYEFDSPILDKIKEAIKIINENDKSFK